MFDPDLPFDPTKPFYPLVINYIIQVHGFIEIVSRAVVMKLEGLPPEQLEQIQKREDAGEIQVQGVRHLMEGGRTNLILQQGLASKVQGTSVRVDIDGLAREVLTDYQRPLDYVNKMSAGGLVILSYELTRAFHTGDPLWEFLRHCRNAAAHKGHFNFLGNEPKRLAAWRGLEIVRSLQGTELFNDSPQGGFMGPGDVLYLLLDIEQAFPSIT